MAGEVRQKIDQVALERFIQQNVPEIKTPLSVKQFGYGQSNPTYLLTASDNAKYVLRKKPPGSLLSSTAHQVDREYKIIHALEHTEVPVPRAICLCEDTAVVGTIFYIMSFLQGRIFEDPALPGVSVDERREMWRSVITTLGKFHNVKPGSVGLEGFGRPDGFYNRQLKTFQKISLAQAETVDVDSNKPVGKIPHFDDMSAFFGRAATQPKDRSAFVHGDYKVDNLVFHPTEPRVIGILDWEMATIGHPLSDLVNLIMPFTLAGQPKALEKGRVNPAFLPGKTPGLPTKEEIVSWYEEVVGFHYPLKELTWGEAFSTYRGSIITQGIAARYARRQASSEKAREYGETTGPMGEVGWEFVQDVQRQLRDEQKKAKL